MRMLVLLLAVLFVRHVRSFENVTVAVADVVIAFNVTDYVHDNQLMDDGIKAFIEAFTGDDSLAFGDEKMRVAVVQFSNDVHVLIPLQKGTSAAEIKGVKIDLEKASSVNPMKLEEIVPAVRKAAFGPQSGVRPTVPKIEVIVVISKQDNLPGFDDWKKQPRPEAFQLAADVVQQIVHLSSSKLRRAMEPKAQYHLRCSGSSVEIVTEKGAFVINGFKTMGKDAAKRLKAFLDSCSYKKLMPCHYESQDCVARVNSVHNKYCRMLTCPGGAEECKKQCDEFSKWTDCKDGMCMRIPKDTDSETIFYWEMCMKFSNFSTVAGHCRVGGDVPVRMIVALLIILLLIYVLLAVFIAFFYKKIYRRQPYSETPKMVEFQRRERERQRQRISTFQRRHAKVVEPKSARNVKAVEPKSTKESHPSPSRVSKLDNPSVLKSGSTMKKSSSMVKSVR